MTFPTTRPNRRLAIPLAVAAVASLAPGLQDGAFGANKTWAAASGNWSVSGNWTPSGAPAVGDAAFLTQSDAANRVVTFDAGGALAYANVVINATGTGSMLLSQGGLNLTSTNIGLGTSGKGHFVKTLGLLNVTTMNFGTGGAGAGTFEHLGGASTVSFVNLGSFRAGTLNLAGGSLNVNTMNMAAGVGSSGHLEITGGTLALSGTLNVGNAAGGVATVNLTGGRISNGAVVIHPGGTFNRTNPGVNAAAQVILSGGTYNESGGGNPIALFTQNSGTVGLGGFVNNNGYAYNGGAFLGRLTSFGTVTFNADFTADNGWLSRPVTENVEIPAGRTITLNGLGLRHDSRNFVVNAGATLLVSDLELGTGLAPQGTLLMEGRTTVFGELRAGVDGTGAFIQNAGTLLANAASPGGITRLGVTAPGFLTVNGGTAGFRDIAVGDTASGTLNLNGTGDLSATLLRVSPGAFAGTVTHSGAGAVASVVNLQNFAGGVYQLSGGTLNITTGSTRNDGSFSQSGGRALLRDVDGTGSMALFGTASLTVNRIRQNRVVIEDNARVLSPSSGSPSNVSRMNELFFEEVEFNVDGQWDLTNNHVVIDHAPSVGASTYQSIRLYVQSGHNFGNWAGDGLRSSAAAAAASTSSPTGLGYARSTDVFAAFPATFLGQSIDDSTVLVRYTLLGDGNVDGAVNIGDFAVLASNFNLPGDWVDGDFNYNGTVNIADFSLLAANFNKSMPADAALQRAGVVPEPSTAALVATGAAIVLSLRRRGTRSWLGPVPE